jgi:hydroxymethylbilane synthase
MKSDNLIVLGTRGSALALAQVQLVRAMLRRACPRLEVEVAIIKTSGDKMKTASLAHSGTRGLFTRELEQALLRRKADVAVHSLKDLPVELPPGLLLAAVTEREDARDVLIAAPGTDLRAPKKVFSSSPRRNLQIHCLWPSCELAEIRGNVETRLRKVAEARPGDALLLAAAGLRRIDILRGDDDEGALAWDPPLAYRKLPLTEMLPAPGQAAIGLEIRADDGVNRERLRSVNHFNTWAAVTTERAFLKGLGGGCAAPVAAYGSVVAERLHLRGVVFDGKGGIWRGERSGERREAEAMGEALARECPEGFRGSRP